MGILQAALTNFAQTVTEGLNGAYVPSEDLEERIANYSANVTWVAAISLIVLTILAALLKDRFEKLKLPLFIMISFVMAGSTLYLAGSTVYLNVKSDSGGPVHWHADIEVWACGNELELRDPFEFLSNKIGTATLHEHNDRRIHLEGVVVEEDRDASLGKFFHVIDGAITADAMVVPLNPEGHEGGLFEDEIDGDGPSDANASLIEPFLVTENDMRYARFESGQTCGDEEAYVQVFVYNYNEETKTYQQTKLSDPVTYSISRTSTVPSGDCIIFEFDVAKSQTNKLCEQYGIRDVDRCEQFGVGQDERAICEITQLNYPAEDPNIELLQTAPEDDSSAAGGTQPAGSESDFDDTPGSSEGLPEEPVTLPDTEGETE